MKTTTRNTLDFLRPSSPGELDHAAARGFGFHVARGRSGAVTVRRWHEDGPILARAGGYGYDKASAALAGVLCYLPGLTAEQSLRVASCSAAGMRTLRDTLCALGWDSADIGNFIFVWRLGSMPPVLRDTASARRWEGMTAVVDTAARLLPRLEDDGSDAEWDVCDVCDAISAELDDHGLRVEVRTDD